MLLLDCKDEKTATWITEIAPKLDGWKGSAIRFVTSIREQVLHITLTNGLAVGLIPQWRVLSVPSIFNHRTTRFTLS